MLTFRFKSKWIILEEIVRINDILVKKDWFFVLKKVDESFLLRQADRNK